MSRNEIRGSSLSQVSSRGFFLGFPVPVQVVPCILFSFLCIGSWSIRGQLKSRHQLHRGWSSASASICLPVLHLVTAIVFTGVVNTKQEGTIALQHSRRLSSIVRQHPPFPGSHLTLSSSRRASNYSETSPRLWVPRSELVIPSTTVHSALLAQSPDEPPYSPALRCGLISLNSNPRHWRHGVQSSRSRLVSLLSF